jgi:hypothetical protein
MARALKLLVLAALVALIALAVARLRASRAASSGIESEGEIPGSFDSWPEVPQKVPSAA